MQADCSAELSTLSSVASAFASDPAGLVSYLEEYAKAHPLSSLALAGLLAPTAPLAALVLLALTTQEAELLRVALAIVHSASHEVLRQSPKYGEQEGGGFP